SQPPSPRGPPLEVGGGSSPSGRNPQNQGKGRRERPPPEAPTPPNPLGVHWVRSAPRNLARNLGKRNQGNGLSSTLHRRKLGSFGHFSREIRALPLVVDRLVARVAKAERAAAPCFMIPRKTTWTSRKSNSRGESSARSRIN